MMTIKEELLRRADAYAQRHGMVLWANGLVMVFTVSFLSQKASPNRGARQGPRAPGPISAGTRYLRLRDREVSEIRGCHVPGLLRYDDELWVIAMEVVTRPFVLDFAGAYLDYPPDYFEEVITEWRIEKQEQFGDRSVERGPIEGLSVTSKSRT